MSWQVQEAKQKLSQVIRQALEEGPQVITRHGEEVVVMVSADTYRKLSGAQPDFKTFLQSGPDLSQLEIERSKEIAVAVEL